MGFRVQILKHSIAPNGHPLVTWVWRFPRILLPEVNTHRVLSRNTSSSRAIPSKKLRKQVIDDPFVPEYVGANQSGMSARQELAGWRRWLALQLWSKGRYAAVFLSWAFEKVGLHKQLANRVLEPWLWCEQIVSATELDNLFKLRDHPDAQPEFQTLARLLREALEESQPTYLHEGQWHIPFIDEETEYDLPLDVKLTLATARCARVSYLNFNGKRDPADDVRLHDQLAASGHWSPFEHSAQALGRYDVGFRGNFRGWLQYRKFWPGESGMTQ